MLSWWYHSWYNANIKRLNDSAMTALHHVITSQRHDVTSILKISHISQKFGSFLKYIFSSCSAKAKKHQKVFLDWGKQNNDWTTWSQKLIWTFFPSPEFWNFRFPAVCKKIICDERFANTWHIQRWLSVFLPSGVSTIWSLNKLVRFDSFSALELYELSFRLLM